MAHYVGLRGLWMLRAASILQLSVLPAVSIAVTLDCALRGVAFDAVAAIAPPNLRAAWDALELAGLCNASAPPRPPRSVPRGAAAPYAAADLELWVDAKLGNDTARGSKDAPLRTVRRALALAALAPRLDSTTILLRGGMHCVGGAPLEIGSQHSGLVLRSAPNESATLSGATALRGLQFKRDARGLLYAALPASLALPDGVGAWTELFVADGTTARSNAHTLDGTGSRYTKARWPDGDAERASGRCTLTSRASPIGPGGVKDGCAAWAIPNGSCGNVMPFVNGSWIEESSPLYFPRMSWNAPPFVFDGFVAVEGGTSVDRFQPPMSSSSTSWGNENGVSNCVRATNLSTRFPRWNVGGTGGAQPCDASDRVTNSNGCPTALLHAFSRPLGGAWGTHAYELDSTTVNSSASKTSQSIAGELALGAGGWHLAAPTQTVGRYFVENLKAELTAPGEWYLERIEPSPSSGNAATYMLWIVPNGTLAEKAAATRISGGEIAVDVYLVGLSRLISITGSGDLAHKAARVQNVRITGLTFTHTAQAFVPSVGGKYEVPSNQDWSVLREGAVVISDGAENITIESSTFWRLGGNGIVLSGHARHCSIASSEFAFLGESAIVSVGRATLWDGTRPTYPEGNLIEGNHIHGIGVWGKQTAGYVQFLTANTTVRSNVIHDVPRAAISLNDNFGGGNMVDHNVIFNTCRETADHGPLNSWSRMGYVTKATGVASLAVRWTTIAHNLVVVGWSGGANAEANQRIFPLDYDDGSDHIHSVSNVLLYGGFKACWRSNSQTYVDNLIVYPSGNSCASCWAGEPSPTSTAATGKVPWGKNESMTSNHCIAPELWRGPIISPMASWCNASSGANLNNTAMWSANNSYYCDGCGSSASTRSPHASHRGLLFQCGATKYNLSQWQALWASVGVAGGGEAGSRALPLPPTETIAAMARSRILM